MDYMQEEEEYDSAAPGIGYEIIEAEQDDGPELIIETLTPSPCLNEFFALGYAAARGDFSIDAFRKRLEEEILRFHEIYRYFLQIYDDEELTGEASLQAEQVLQSLEKYQEALEVLDGAVQDTVPGLMERGLQQAAAAINSLTESYDGFVRNQSGKECSCCTEQNPPGTLYCSNCGSLFTLSAEELPIEFSNLKWKAGKGSFGAAAFPGSMIEIYDNYFKIDQQDMVKEKYLENVDWLITQFEMARIRLERETRGAPPEALESAAMLIEGVDKTRKALGKIRDRVAIGQNATMEKEWNNLLIAIHAIAQSQQ